MGTWVPIRKPLGTILTRRRHQLSLGEFVQASAIRMRFGDTVQMDRDVGTVLYDYVRPGGEFLPTNITDFAHLSFENEQDLLLVLSFTSLSSNTASVALNTAPAGINNPVGLWTGTDLDLLVSSTDSPKGNLGAVHFGDQYFIGWGGNDPTIDRSRGLMAVAGEPNPLNWKPIGMKTPLGAGLERERGDDGKFFLNWQENADTGTAVQIAVIYLAFPRKIGFISLNSRVTNPTVRAYVSGITLSEATPATAPGENPPDTLSDYDTFMYFVTEYDEETDTESRPYYAQLVAARTGGVTNNEEKPGVFFFDSGKRPKFDFSGYEKINDRATHLRVYRTYIGAGTTSGSTDRFDGPDFLGRFYATVCGGYRRTEALAGGGDLLAELYDDKFPVGGLVAKIDLSDTGEDATFTDPIWITTDPVGVVWSYHLEGFYKQEPPRRWDMGVVMGEQLLLNNLDENVLQYSLEENPEYFPRSNVIGLAKEGTDKPLAMHKIGKRAFVTARSRVIRVDFIPDTSGDPENPITEVSNSGSVGRKASTVVTLPQGQALVWLGNEILHLSTGDGDIPVCRDFSVSRAGIDPSTISNAVLIDNKRQGRLELYCQRFRETGNHTAFHFYYDVDKLKDTGFMLTGPHKVPRTDPQDLNTELESIVSSAVEGAADRTANLWVASRNRIYTLNQDYTPEPIWLDFGNIDFTRTNPKDRVDFQRVALQHAPISPEKSERGVLLYPIKLHIRTKSLGKKWNPVSTIEFTNDGFDEIEEHAIRGQSGHLSDVRLEYHGPGFMSLMPIHFNVSVSSDGGT